MGDLVCGSGLRRWSRPRRVPDRPSWPDRDNGHDGADPHQDHPGRRRTDAPAGGGERVLAPVAGDLRSGAGSDVSVAGATVRSGSPGGDRPDQGIADHVWALVERAGALARKLSAIAIEAGLHDGDPISVTPTRAAVAAAAHERAGDMIYLRQHWERQPPNRQAWLRWSLPLAALALLIGADWWHLQRAGVASTATVRELLGRVGYTCAISAVVMVLGVRRWPLQSLGLFGLLMGLAGLFLRVIARMGPQPVGERERDLIQAALDIGSIVLLVGLIVWGIGRVRGRAPEAPTNGI